MRERERGVAGLGLTWNYAVRPATATLLSPRHLENFLERREMITLTLQSFQSQTTSQLSLRLHKYLVIV